MRIVDICTRIIRPGDALTSHEGRRNDDDVEKGAGSSRARDPGGTSRAGPRGSDDGIAKGLR